MFIRNKTRTTVFYIRSICSKIIGTPCGVKTIIKLMDIILQKRYLCNPLPWGKVKELSTQMIVESVHGVADNHVASVLYK